MAIDLDNTKRKYEAIRKEYPKWTKKSYKGVRMYTDELIFFKLHEKYFLSPKTIEEIVFYRTKN